MAGNKNRFRAIPQFSILTIAVMESISKKFDIAARFFDTAKLYSDHPAVGFSGDDTVLTYFQLAEKVLCFAASLRDIKPGQPVGLLSENRPEWCAAYLAILSRAGVIVPVDSLLKDEEMAAIVAASGADHIFVSEKFQSRLEKIISAHEHPARLINLENADSEGAWQTDISFPVSPDDTAVLIFTSGTTGNPKKVILTHRNILSDIDDILKIIPLGPGSRFLSVLPLHHTFEATGGFLAPIMRGCAIYYVKELNSRQILNGIKKHRITHLLSVPLLFEKIYEGILSGVKKAPPLKRFIFNLIMKVVKTIHNLTGKNLGRALFAGFRKKAGMDSIELLISGGAPLPSRIAAGFSQMGFCFIEGYGLTETSPVLTLSPPYKVRPGSVGIALDSVEIKIIDPDNKGVGEIIACGPMITPGYLDNPDETVKLIRDGWLHTGDLGRLDSDGYLYIMGRNKNLIVSAAGKNIYPEEIEEEILRSPYIIEMMVYGRKNRDGREEVSALVYPDFERLESELGRKSEDITDDDLKSVIGSEINRICGGMANYKRIKHIEYMRQELQKTSTRKIKRHLYQK